MKTLLLMRHAEAIRDFTVGDYDRPLSEYGKQQAARIGKILRAKGLVPDLIISSTAVIVQGG
jgi:phosphohistidine phosphatase